MKGALFKMIMNLRMATRTCQTQHGPCVSTQQEWKGKIKPPTHAEETFTEAVGTQAQQRPAMSSDLPGTWWRIHFLNQGEGER